MPATLLRARTKSDRVTTAEFTFLAGYTTTSMTTGRVRCTLCGSNVHTTRQTVEYQLETWSAALVGALVNHYDVCTVVTR